jgi:DNA-binding NarL/FixJ family response regulator
VGAERGPSRGMFSLADLFCHSAGSRIGSTGACVALIIHEAFTLVGPQTTRNREAGELQVALIDSRPLVCSAVACLLQTWRRMRGVTGTFVVVQFADIAEFEAHCPELANDLDLVALNIGAASLSDDQIRSDVRRLSEHISNLPLVLMSDFLRPKLALDLIREGIKGYIPATLSAPVTIEALRLVCAGETFIPSDLLQYATDESQCGTPARDADCALQAELTARQRAVLALLRQGKPNKIIAAQLEISESTVKVYVRQIMKKLGAVNRTHACYLLQRVLPSPWSGETHGEGDPGTEVGRIVG